ncbi:MAG: hypothetical protein OEM76_05270 [Gammaproteobacteria bacterium]|nr:hypothetical protein [Gammaproteobacteria bacterium]MDH3410327.1 hypothetical protein [Gammaproteobacteria bacterium]
MSEKTVVSIHWSFWVIGVVGLIFNLLGCINFLSQMNAETVASMPEIYRTIAESRPAWGTAAFALAVFGGLLGCLLLLLRKSVALYVFVASVVGAIAAQIPFVGMADFPVEAWVGWLSQVAVGVFLVWYSRLAKSKEWIG